MYDKQTRKYNNLNLSHRGLDCNNTAIVYWEANQIDCVPEDLCGTVDGGIHGLAKKKRKLTEKIELC